VIERLPQGGLITTCPGLVAVAVKPPTPTTPSPATAMLPVPVAVAVLLLVLLLPLAPAPAKVPVPVAVAVLLLLLVLPKPAAAVLLVPVAVAVLLLLLVLKVPARAVLLVPVAVAVLLVPPEALAVPPALALALSWAPVAVAELSVPWAIATEPVPDEETAVLLPTRSVPLVETLTLPPPLGVDEEPELDGVADATHGVAANPTPMPRATANPPTRPMYFAAPMMVPLVRQPHAHDPMPAAMSG
jgi:hypothetical protein